MENLQTPTEMINNLQPADFFQMATNISNKARPAHELYYGENNELKRCHEYMIEAKRYFNQGQIQLGVETLQMAMMVMNHVRQTRRIKERESE